MIISEFDSTLQAKARTLATLVLKLPNKGLDFDFAPEIMPEFGERRRDAEYFQIWYDTGEVLQRSPSLGKNNLRSSGGSVGRPNVWNLRLPDRRNGRAVSFDFVPQVDNDPNEAANVVLPPGMSPNADFHLRLVFARNRTPLDRTLQILQGCILAVAILLPLASALLVWLMVVRGLKPLDHLADEVSAIDSDLLAHRFDAAALPGELQPIVRCLNSLLQRLEAAFQRERRFTADVAHELRTPVAELRSLTEVALIEPRDPTLAESSVREARDIARQMDALITTLLALARSQAGQQSLAMDFVQLDQLVLRVWEIHAAAAKQRGLRVTVELEENLSARTDAALLERVLQNLYANAVAHTPAGGKIEVRLLAVNDKVTLRIANTNATLKPEDLAHLFEPFWQKDAARTDSAHSGLGLPLVSALCELMGIRLDASLDEPNRFKVQLGFSDSPVSASNATFGSLRS